MAYSAFSSSPILSYVPLNYYTSATAGFHQFSNTPKLCLRAFAHASSFAHLPFLPLFTLLVPPQPSALDLKVTSSERPHLCHRHNQSVSQLFTMPGSESAEVGRPLLSSVSGIRLEPHEGRIHICLVHHCSPSTQHPAQGRAQNESNGRVSDDHGFLYSSVSSKL